jgi:ABC-2 type transport system permease protein
MAVVIATHFQRALAVSLAQFVYYPLVYAGGLWTPWRSLPEGVRAVSPFLPTRHLGELGWGLLKDRVAFTSIAVLAAYAAVFGALAVTGLRRQVEREA